MIKIRDLDLTVTRGDTTEFVIEFTENTPENGTTALVTVKDPEQPEYTFLRKEFAVENGKVAVSLTADEMRRVPPGKWTWDVRFVYEDGRVYTPMFQAMFHCMEANGDV